MAFPESPFVFFRNSASAPQLLVGEQHDRDGLRCWASCAQERQNATTTVLSFCVVRGPGTSKSRAPRSDRKIADTATGPLQELAIARNERGEAEIPVDRELETTDAVH